MVEQLADAEAPRHTPAEPVRTSPQGRAATRPFGRMAVVHDWFATSTGAERCVEQMIAAYPDLDLFSLVETLPRDARDCLRGKKVKTSFIQRLPFARKHFRAYLPLMPFAIEQFDLSDYEVVVSSSWAFAKGVVTTSEQLHLSYLYTPIRYAWDLHHEYLNQFGVASGLKSLPVRATLHYVRQWDRLTADRVDAFASISKFVAQRAWKTYRRPSRVIYPPVDVEAFTLEPNKEDFYFTASRLVPYKCIDRIVEAFALLPDRRLIVIGDGPQMRAVRAKAGPNVTLLGYQPKSVLQDHMRRARAFLFCSKEDFGIAPVEAQACGTPVIAFGRGGVTETVIDGSTGLFFHEQDPACIVDAVRRFERVEDRFEPEAIRDSVLRFGNDRFRAELAQFAEDEWRRWRSGIDREIEG